MTAPCFDLGSSRERHSNQLTDAAGCERPPVVRRPKLAPILATAVLSAWVAGRSLSHSFSLGKLPDSLGRILAGNPARPATVQCFRHGSHSPGKGSCVSGLRHKLPAVAAGEATLQQECVLPPTAPLSALAFSLVKNIVGAGVLSLPAGVAAFSDLPSALLPAMALLAMMGLIAAYTFALIARSCDIVGAMTYRGAWAGAIGDRSSWVVALVSTMKTGLGCLMFSMILADSAASLAAGFGAPAFIADRGVSLLLVTGFCVLPICFLETLAMLQYTSVLGILGMLYTFGAMLVRLIQGAYVTGGSLHDVISPTLQPAVGVHGGSFFSSPASFVLVSCLSTSFVAHYNAPKYFRELEERSMPRFYRLVLMGFGGSAALFGAITTCGFLTFGGAASGVILNNYAASDHLILVARLAISLSILCSYPLLFTSLRENIIEALPQRLSRVAGPGCVAPRTVVRKATVLLISIITLLASRLTDFSLVAAISGATLGNLLIMVFPALIFLGATRAELGPRGGRFLRLERTLCRCLIAFGILLAGIGTSIALNGKH